jgi:chlorite dismutase
MLHHNTSGSTTPSRSNRKRKYSMRDVVRPGTFRSSSSRTRQFILNIPTTTPPPNDENTQALTTPPPPTTIYLEPKTAAAQSTIDKTQLNSIAKSVLASSNHQLVATVRNSTAINELLEQARAAMAHAVTNIGTWMANARLYHQQQTEQAMAQWKDEQQPHAALVRALVVVHLLLNEHQWCIDSIPEPIEATQSMCQTIHDFWAEFLPAATTTMAVANARSHSASDVHAPESVRLDRATRQYVCIALEQLRCCTEQAYKSEVPALQVQWTDFTQAKYLEADGGINTSSSSSSNSSSDNHDNDNDNGTEATNTCSEHVNKRSRFATLCSSLRNSLGVESPSRHTSAVLQTCDEQPYWCSSPMKRAYDSLMSPTRRTRTSLREAMLFASPSSVSHWTSNQHDNINEGQSADSGIELSLMCRDDGSFVSVVGLTSYSFHRVHQIVQMALRPEASTAEIEETPYKFITTSSIKHATATTAAATATTTTTTTDNINSTASIASLILANGCEMIVPRSDTLASVIQDEAQAETQQQFARCIAIYICNPGTSEVCAQ